jgi:uncharacterized protein (TIGR02611 family)
MRLAYVEARRITVAVIGATLIAVGFVMLFTPGPGIVVVSLALGILATEFAWARRWLRRLRQVAAVADRPDWDRDDDDASATRDDRTGRPAE